MTEQELPEEDDVEAQPDEQPEADDEGTGEDVKNDEVPEDDSGS